MKGEFKNIDDLLRSALSDYKKNPTEGVWRRLINKLPGSGIISKLSTNLLWIFIAVIIIIPISWIYFTNTGSDKEAADKTNLEIPVSITSVGIENNQSEINNSTQLSENKSTEFNPEPAGIPVKTDSNISKSNIVLSNSEPQQENTGKSAVNSVFVESTSEGMAYNRDIYLPDGYFPFLMKGTFTGKTPALAFASDLPSSVLMRRVTYGWPAIDNKLYTKDDYGKKGNWIYGISVVPEIIIPGTDKSQKGIAIELTGRHTIGEFSLEGGFGLNISEDDGRFNIDYEQYDSVAYYYKVTSFTIDEATGKPTFNTNLETVYDTVEYTASASPKNSYTYLYFPVYAGMEVSRFNRLSLHVNAGLIYSIMISKNESAVTYQNDKATSIHIENNTPARITSQMLLAGSLGLHYQISTNTFLNLEPIFKYYFKPLYENRYNPGTTYSIGLRTGLYVKF